MANTIIIIIMDLVTVIIPYYKKKNFIKEAILSAVSQTYQNLEILIIYDDESHDDLDFIKQIEKLDKRISLIINTKRLGAGLSRNLGIESSKGTFIAFLDSDDIWKKNKIEKQLHFMKENNFKISHTSYEIINQKNNIIGMRVARSFNNLQDLLISCDIGLSTVLLEKEILSEECLFPHLKTKEDFVLWLKIIKKNIIIAGIDENLASWRKLNNSLSSSTLQKLFDGFSVYHNYMKFSFMKSIYYLFCLSVNYLKKK